MLDTQPKIEIQEAEYSRLLGYPRDHEMEGRARHLADWAREWYAENGTPWTFDRRTDELQFSSDGFSIDGTTFRSSRLRRQLIDAKAREVMLVAVSAGRECEEQARKLWEEGKPDEYFFLEVYGSAVVEHLITLIGARFCSWADQHGAAVLPHYSPGYPTWTMAEQGLLWQLLRGQGKRGMPSDLDVLDTGMLRPKKSQLAVFGITTHVDSVQRLSDLVPCGACPMLTCQYRRTPYERPPRIIEQVGKPQATALRSARNRVSLNHRASYSTNIKALRKWSGERLQMEIKEDLSVEACFRYEGTTCSNLGHPLSFDYRVVLEPPEDGYRIAEASCTPASGDQGYTLMCNFIKDADSLMTAIDVEKPLLGRPLEDVLTWGRQFSPAGCYCKAASRSHKWGLALEVIHFALVQVEKQSIQQN